MKAKLIFGLGIILAAVLIVPITLSQSVPQLINFQGRLTDSSGQPLDGVTVDLTFAFYGSASGGTAMLTVLQEDVLVSGGIYNLTIGSGTIIPGSESTLAGVFQKHAEVWMGVKVDADAEMTPRTRITSVPYAITIDPGFVGDLIAKPDWDGDGYLKTGNTVDCNDGDPLSHPGADENCSDGYDNDCDGKDDGVDLDCVPPPPGMALIPPGCFDMGDPFGEGESSELPVHNVCITSGFFMDIHEVTNMEYFLCEEYGGCPWLLFLDSWTRELYHNDPTYENYPVIYVDWNQATAYCAWAGKRLPTEAEWEYAARGGLSGSRYAWGDSITCDDANYGRSSPVSPCYDYGGRDNDTHEVGSYAVNGYGLYDMNGNVWEWVNDWYSDTYYQYCVDNNIFNDPPGPASGTDRVIRGGTWYEDAYFQRLAIRQYDVPGSFFYSLGFRCAKD